MTEQDWAYQAQKESPVYDHEDLKIQKYAETLLVWSDWCEDEGLDYARGLRMLVDLFPEAPRCPMPNSPYDSTWPRGKKVFRWSNRLSVKGVTLQILPSRVLSRLNKVPVTCLDKITLSHPWLRKRFFPVVSYYYASWLDAMKAAALAVQKTYSTRNTCP